MPYLKDAGQRPRVEDGHGSCGSPRGDRKATGKERLKQLAELKAAALVTCESCLDVGSALAAAHGITEKQLRDLPRFADSDAFSPDEKLVLEFAEAMSRTPAVVAGELRDRLLGRFSPAQVTELAATVAWENNRGRLNQALGVRPAEFSDGAMCAMPEP